MTPEHAAAATEMTRLEHAVPAEQRTRRSVQQTIRHYGVIAVAVFFGILSYVKHECGAVAVGLVTVLGGNVLFIEYFNGEKRQNKRKSQSNAQED